MRPILACSLFLAALFPAHAQQPDPATKERLLDRLFATWEKTQRDIKSLVVEFTLETKDRTFDECHKSNGKFRLIRTEKGQLFASYELSDWTPDGGNKPPNLTGLLNSGNVYLMNHQLKRAIRFEATDAKLRGFLEKYFNPFVMLTDRKHAEQKCKLDIVKQDEWYTYLAAKPKQPRSDGWFLDTFHEGGVALMNSSTNGVPRDMPRQLWYYDGVMIYTFNIQLWQVNAAGAPKIEEFARPEERPGWEVLEWALGDKKQIGK